MMRAVVENGSRRAFVSDVLVFSWLMIFGTAGVLYLWRDEKG
jgi:hypothetical protein